MTCVAWIGSIAGIPRACCRPDVAEIDGLPLCATHRADVAAGRIVTPIDAVRAARVVGTAEVAFSEVEPVDLQRLQVGLFGGGV